MKIRALIPYYNYLTGVRNIERVLNRNKNNFNYTVSNDSDEIKLNRNNNWIEGPHSGAVKNWNYLLSQLNESHFMLIHQDEEIVIKDNFSKAELNPDTVYVCDLAIKRAGIYIYLPSNLRVYLINKLPSLIFRVNFIGPTASLIIPKNNLRFNEELKWLVDVDYYYRLRMKYKFKAVHGLCIISNTEIGQSITNSESSEVIASWRRNEMKLLGIKNRTLLSIFVRFIWRLYRIFMTRKVS